MTKQKTQGAEAEPSWKRNSDTKFGKILISELNGIFTKAYLRRGSGGLTPPLLEIFSGGSEIFSGGVVIFSRGVKGGRLKKIQWGWEVFIRG